MFSLAITIVLGLLNGPVTSRSVVSPDNGEDTVLYLLNVQPFPDDRPKAGWDRALELIPAGELAIEQINNRSDLLPGYRLELINVDSEACGISMISKGLVNTYEHLVDQNIVVAGVVGLFCSTVTSVIAPIVNFTIFDRVMVAGSTSPIHRNPKLYPRLYHTISSSNVFSNAVIRMMEEFDWQKVSIVHDSEGVIFSSSASYFAEQINSIPNIKLIQSVQIILSLVSNVIPQLITENTRIIFAIVTGPEAAKLMCEAYKTNSLWPAYVYIFQERTISDFLVSKTSCTSKQMIEAIEGIFLLNYKLEAEPETELVSGLSYTEYYREYLQRLEKVEEQQNRALDPNNTYANVAYDQVWALALALNKSNTVLHSIDLTFEDYGHNQTLISDIIQEQLLNLGFEGAAGFINFTDNQETVSSVVIHQVRNGAVNFIGFYNPQANESITMLAEIDDLPSDQFDSVNRYLPLWLAVLTTLVTIVCYVLTTLLLVAFFYYRNRAEIKASSLYLSMLLFIGCYMLYTAVLSKNILRGFAISGFTFVCNLEAWSTFNGLNLIYGTLFLRLLRIQHVFKTFGNTSKYWSDQFLFFGVLAIVAVGNILLVVWTASDTLHKETSVTYVSGDNLPYFEVSFYCSSENRVTWVLLSFAYSLIILAVTVYLSIQTRHIKHSNFKDTKKINGYAFASAFSLIFGISFSLVLQFGIGSDIGEHIILSLSILLLGILCQCFLIASKVLPLLFSKRPKRYISTGYTNRSSL